mmetsp:Transcript_80213/g.166966  ORF Transcript_80213/g.166966 Transcript_80213/m.166966 type:complete len:165 (-) Transcript_80213:1285-1779(-)
MEKLRNSTWNFLKQLAPGHILFRLSLHALCGVVEHMAAETKSSSTMAADCSTSKFSRNTCASAVTSVAGLSALVVRTLRHNRSIHHPRSPLPPSRPPPPRLSGGPSKRAKLAQMMKTKKALWFVSNSSRSKLQRKIQEPAAESALRVSGLRDYTAVLAVHWPPA